MHCTYFVYKYVRKVEIQPYHVHSRSAYLILEIQKPYFDRIYILLPLKYNRRYVENFGKTLPLFINMFSKEKYPLGMVPAVGIVTKLRGG